jgi:hypothetical protein
MIEIIKALKKNLKTYLHLYIYLMIQLLWNIIFEYYHGILMELKMEKKVRWTS